PEALSSWRSAAGKKLLQGASRRGIGLAIDAFGAEMALKCGHDLQCGRVIVAIGLYPIPIVAQRFLQPDNGVSLRARRKHLAEIHDRCRLHPMADAGFVKRTPGKFLAWVLLAGGRNIGMSQDSRRRNRNAGLNAAAERRHRGNLAFWKIRVAVVMTGIGDFDSDRTRIDVGFAGPFRLAGVPSPAAFRNHLNDPTILEYKIVGRDIAALRA